MGISFNGVAKLAHMNLPKLLRAWKTVVESGVFIDGSQKEILARRLSKLYGKGVALVASCHDAILLTLLSLGLNPTDEIIVPANAYPTAFPAVLSGATVRLCDVDENGQLDPEALKKVVTKRTKVVIVVHLYGLIGNIERIARYCTSKHIRMLEDCAQAFGSEYNNLPVGSFGTAACYSFYPTKNLGGLGTGGAVISKSRKLVTYIKEASSYGEKKRYHSQFLAGHSWVSELTWAGITVYLDALPTQTRQKKAVASWYYEEIVKANIPSIKPFVSHPKSRPLMHLFVIRAQRRNELRAFLTRHHIPTYIHYPVPVHLVKSMKTLSYKRGDFPVTERLAKEMISLPFHAYMKQKEVARIVRTIQQFYEKHAR